MNCSIRPIDRTLTGNTTPGQRVSGSNGNEELLHIPKAAGLEPHHHIVLYTIAT